MENCLFMTLKLLFLLLSFLRCPNVNLMLPPAMPPSCRCRNCLFCCYWIQPLAQPCLQKHLSRREAQPGAQLLFLSVFAVNSEHQVTLPSLHKVSANCFSMVSHDTALSVENSKTWRCCSSLNKGDVVLVKYFWCVSLLPTPVILWDFCARSGYIYMRLQLQLKVSRDSCVCRVFTGHQRSDTTSSVIPARM